MRKIIIITDAWSPQVNGVVSTFENIAFIYYYQGDYGLALDHYIMALELDKKSDNKKRMSDHLGNIGGVYYNLGEYAKSLNYLFNSLKGFLMIHLGFFSFQKSQFLYNNQIFLNCQTIFIFDYICIVKNGEGRCMSIVQLTIALVVFLS